MIQDILPHRFHNEFRPEAKAADSDVVMPWRDGSFLAACDPDKGSLAYPQAADLKDGLRESLRFLFTIDGSPFFLLSCEEGMEPPEILKDPAGYAFQTMQQLRRVRLEPRLNVFAAFTAFHLAGWYDANRFCGWCGARSEPDKVERAMRCPVCGKVEYPRINPAVIVGVTDGDRLLMTKYRVGYGGYALVAGFTEIGETLEETVAREVMEEVGLKVKNIRYYKSQPWGIAADILVGYYCDADGDPSVRLDENELKVAEWVKREDIEGQALDYSLTGEMMQMFKEGKEPRGNR